MNFTSASAPTSSSTAATAAPFAVGFDFDHTLGMDHALELTALQTYFDTTFGLQTRSNTDEARVVESVLKEFRDDTNLAHKDRAQSRLLQEIGRQLKLTTQQLQELNIITFRHICISLVPRTTPYEGLKELFQFFHSHRIPVAILTNGWSPLQQLKIAHVLGDARPKYILVSDELNAMKPDERAFHSLLQLDGFKGRSKDQIYYVGDNPSGDVIGALKAGLKGIWMDVDEVQYPPNQPQPTRIVKSLHQLRELFHQLLQQQQHTPKSKL